MRIWVEVSSGDWAWTKKIQNSNHDDKRGLKAPATTRYVNLLKEVREGDIILSYLTKSLTQNSKCELHREISTATTLL